MNDIYNSVVSTECYTCRIAERIWGNCEVPSGTRLETLNAHNRIKRPLNTNGQIDDEGTLLSWFAKNTGTMDQADSCRATSCGPGFALNNQGACVPADLITSSGEECPIAQHFKITDTLTNCCPVDTKNKPITDGFDNCCLTGTTGTPAKSSFSFGTSSITSKICTNDQTPNIIASYTDNGTAYDIVCMGDVNWTNAPEKIENYPNGTTIKCNGTLVRIQKGKNKALTLYSSPNNNKISTFNDKNSQKCYYDELTNTWRSSDNAKCDTIPNHISINIK